MATSWTLSRRRQAIERLSETGLRWGALSGEIIGHLRRAVGFDGWCVTLTDPAAGLPAVAVAEDSPVAGCQRRFWQLASLVTRTMDGQWAELHAAPLTGTSPSGQHVAVGVRPASPARIRALLTRAYQLSDRERELAGLVLDGLEVADIAAALYISRHTVRDHLKAIFGKTRSHTRHQLAARLSGYEPCHPSQAAVPG